MNKTLSKKCNTCDHLFFKRRNKSVKIFRSTRFCSRSCYGVWRSGENHPMWGKKGSIPWNKGKKGLQVAWNKGTKNLVPHPIEMRRKISESLKGEKSYLWQGGKTEKAKCIRTSFDYRLWREAVFARDDWTCQECGQRGVILNADHIKPFADYPALRLELSNGRTLCKPCHKNTDTYGNTHRDVFGRFIKQNQGTALIA